MHNTLEFLKSHLTQAEYDELKSINNLLNLEDRQFKLKAFFHNPIRFDRIRVYYDPSWIAYDIFINGKKYEF